MCVCLDPSGEACQGDLPDRHRVCPSGPGCFGKPLYTEGGLAPQRATRNDSEDKALARKAYPPPSHEDQHAYA